MSAAIEEKEALGKLAATREGLRGLFEKKNDAGKLDWSAEDHDRHKALTAQVNEEKAAYDRWHGIADSERQNNAELADLKKPLTSAPFGGARQDNHDRDREPERKSVGQAAVESPAYKQYIANSFSGSARLDLNGYGLADFKATMTTAAGYAPFVTRGTDIVPFALRRTTVQDLMPSFPISEKGVEYMEETTITRLAAAVAEGGIKPESARAFTIRTANAEVVATTLPVTEQQLADAPFLMAYINATLGQEIELAEEDQLLTGTGTSPQLQGFLTKTGVQTQAKGTDPVITAFFKALTLIRFTGFAEPSASVWHPNDWQDVVTLQDANGNYIFGDPSSINVNRLWGIPAVVTPAETENTILIGDFRMYAYIVRRMGLRIDIGWVNDQFKTNTKTIRAETRLGLVIRRPSAFAKVVGV